MSPEAEAEAKFMAMAAAAGLKDCGCRVFDQCRVLNAWAHGAGQRDPFTVEQRAESGTIDDEQMAAAIDELTAAIAERSDINSAG